MTNNATNEELVRGMVNVYLSNIKDNQERFIDQIINQIEIDANNYLNKVFTQEVLEKHPELFDFSCYELALMMVKIAAKHTDEYSTHWGFSKRCNEFEEIVYVKE